MLGGSVSIMQLSCWQCCMAQHWLPAVRWFRQQCCLQRCGYVPLCLSLMLLQAESGYLMSHKWPHFFFCCLFFYRRFFGFYRGLNEKIIKFIESVTIISCHLFIPLSPKIMVWIWKHSPSISKCRWCIRVYINTWYISLHSFLLCMSFSLFVAC